MKKGKYFVSPYIVELMENNVPFMVFYDNHQLLEGAEVTEWINEQSLGVGLLAAAEATPYMIAHPIKGGYSLKDVRAVETLTIPSEVINQGYAALIKDMDNNGIQRED